jgi:lysophospholipase L1-like esterase
MTARRAAPIATAGLALAAAIAACGGDAGGNRPGVLVLGDSLAVGTRPSLAAALGAREIAWDARGGRTTEQGLARLPADLHGAAPHTVVVSLGTNDGPDPAPFSRAIARVLALVPGDACVVWATVIRPPRWGPYRALNRALRDQARRDRRLVLVHWDDAVRRGRVRLADGVHPDAAGYRYRSRLVADAVRHRCPAMTQPSTAG